MDHQSSTTPHALILGLTLEQAISVLAKKPVDATHYNYLEDDEYNTYVMMKPEWTSLNKHAYLHVIYKQLCDIPNNYAINYRFYLYSNLYLK